MKDHRGVTLIEVTIAVAIMAVLASAFFKLLPVVQTSFRRIQLTQQIQSESASAMDTMSRLLREGKSNTVLICSCNQTVCSDAVNCIPSTAIPPNSQIDFQDQNGTPRAIWWQNNQLVIVDTPTVTANFAKPRVLANNVGIVTFSGDYRDLSVVNVSLFMQATVSVVNGSNGTQNITSILPTKSIRMIGTQ